MFSYRGSHIVKYKQYTTEEAAKDVAAFFAILFNSFPQFKGRALHLTGESYGVGRVPWPSSMDEID